MLLIIDNYDSFTFNLVQLFGELGVTQRVVRNDQMTLEEVAELRPSAIVISPGPCTPDEAGISVPVIKRFASQIPILGVCLGHQSIGQAFGGNVVRAETIVHGKTSEIHHSATGLFKGLPIPFKAARYHSLIVDRSSLPDVLEITATTEDGTIMALRHLQYPVMGVQFHPESVATEHGKQMLKNFLDII